MDGGVAAGGGASSDAKKQAIAYLSYIRGREGGRRAIDKPSGGMRCSEILSDELQSLLADALLSAEHAASGGALLPSAFGSHLPHGGRLGDASSSVQINPNRLTAAL